MKSNALLFFVVVLAVCLTQFAADIYAPSLPSIAKDFYSDISWAQWSMSIYMAGVAVSQLVYGPISEGIGRKIPLIAGLLIMLLGTFICLSSGSIGILIAGRLVQGLGAGACAALWRSIFRDMFAGEELAKKSSYLVIFIMFIVPAAPFLGGFLQEFFGWRSNFVFMSIYTFVALLAIIFGYRETSRHHEKKRMQWPFIWGTFRELLTSKIFMGTTLATFFSYGAFFSWFVAGPVLLIETIGISPIAFGWIAFLGGGSAYALAGWLNGKLVTSWGMPAMMRIGWTIMILSGAFMLLGKMAFGTTLISVVIPAVMLYFGSTFIWPNAFATAFTPFGKVAGYTGSLYGFMQISGGAAVGGLISFLPDEDQVPLAIVVIAASLASWAIYEAAVVRNLRSG